ncbi:hypothetical protein [Companilactobacillus allii]|nr:hypothetical protein [Companilactobacillus allii]
MNTNPIVSLQNTQQPLTIAAKKASRSNISFMCTGRSFYSFGC